MSKQPRNLFLISLGSATVAACSGGMVSYIPRSKGTPPSSTDAAPLKLDVAVRRTGNTGVEALINNTKVFDMSVSKDGFRTIMATGKELRTPLFGGPTIGGPAITAPSGHTIRRTAANRYDVSTTGAGHAQRTLSVHTAANGYTVFSFRAGRAGDKEWPDADLVLAKNIFQTPDQNMRRFSGISMPFQPSQGLTAGLASGTRRAQSIVCQDFWYYTSTYNLLCSCIVGSGTLYSSCWSTGYTPDRWQTVGNVAVSGSGPTPGKQLSDCLYQALIAAGILNASAISETAWLTLTALALEGLFALATTGVGLIAIIVAIIVAAIVSLGIAYADEQIFNTLVKPCASQLGLPVG